MVFSSIRNDIWGVVVNVLLVGSIIAIFKRARNRKLMLVPILICLILLAHITKYPIENLFVRFESLESAFKYHVDKDAGMIDMVVEGGCSAMVVFSPYKNVDVRDMDIDSRMIRIFPKRASGYILPIGYVDTYSFRSRREVNGIKAYFEVYSHNNASDYYIEALIYPIIGSDIRIFNGNDEAIGVLRRLYDKNEFYGYINGLENDINDIYAIIDGEKIPVL